MSTAFESPETWTPSAPKAQLCLDLFDSLVEYPLERDPKTKARVKTWQNDFSHWVENSGALRETSARDSLDFRFKRNPKSHALIIEMLDDLKEYIENGKNLHSTLYSMISLTYPGLPKSDPRATKSPKSHHSRFIRRMTNSPYYELRDEERISEEIEHLTALCNSVPQLRCLCGNKLWRDRKVGIRSWENKWIKCRTCWVLQHAGCGDRNENLPDADNYFCEECRPDLHSFLPGADEWVSFCCHDFAFDWRSGQGCRPDSTTGRWQSILFTWTMRGEIPTLNACKEISWAASADCFIF